MTYQDLIAELKEKEKGCGKRFKVYEDMLAICGKYYYDDKEPTLCDDCKKAVKE